MIVRAVRGGMQAARGDLVVIPVVDKELDAILRRLDRRWRTVVTRRVRDSQFRARPDDALLHHEGSRAVLLLGLAVSAPGAEMWRRAGGRARQEAERIGARRVAVYLGPQMTVAAGSAFGEGFQLAGYRFDRYKSKGTSPRPIDTLALVSEELPAPAAVKTALAHGALVSQQVCLARDVINEPASSMTPVLLAEHARRLARPHKTLQVEVWDIKRLRREKLNGILAVARGSQEEPRLIKVRYAPRGARRRIAIVGKGITFDSGGLSLKTGKGMETMKRDMAGAAAVLGAVTATAALGLNVDVTAYVPTTENMPSGTAYKPGDVIRYLNGKTVEVMNTDAEGRLILADALALASQDKPTVIIDLATLTGACVVALGPLVAGAMGNDQPLLDALVAAGRASGEILWPLPLIPEYKDLMRSPVADLRNVGSSGDAGAIIGGLFLQEFVDGVPWAHLDIAGPSFSESGLPYRPKGATAFGVRLLVEYLRGVAGEGRS